MIRFGAILIFIALTPSVHLDAASPGDDQEQAKARLFEGKPLADWIEAAKNAKSDVQKKAVHVLENTIIPKLIEETQSTEFGIRQSAVEDLGRVGISAKVAVPAVMLMLQDEHKINRVLAASALRKIDPQTKAAVPVLIEALRIRDESLRCFAAVAFADFGEEAVKPLIEVLTELDSMGRAWASASLTNLGKKAFPLVITALHNKDALIRAGCADAISGMEMNGVDISEALPALRLLLNDPDATVREEAKRALRGR